jgi:DNA uptake protein ComE-like DNA-binding protein
LLIVMLLLIVSAFYLLPYLIKNDVAYDTDFATVTEQFQASRVKKSEKKTLTPFPFDPNNIPKEKMIAMGFSDYQAEMIIKYRNAGGKFYSREDFSKIYSISESDFEILEPYILINNSVKKFNPKPAGEVRLRPVAFDPNIADSHLLVKIGLKQNQVQNILRYREAGGSFKIKRDFRKIYSITEDDYHVLENYLLLPSVVNVDVEKPEDDIRENPILVELNSADTSDLIKLRGIGPVFSGRIVAYREKLGGFYDKSQLLEVFGIDTNRYFQFAHQVFADTLKLKKMDLNHTKFKDLLRHPYLEYYLVKSIFNYKDAVGAFRSVDELRQIDMVYDQLFEKIKPYLTVEENLQAVEK